MKWNTLVAIEELEEIKKTQPNNTVPMEEMFRMMISIIDDVKHYNGGVTSISGVKVENEESFVEAVNNIFKSSITAVNENSDSINSASEVFKKRFESLKTQCEEEQKKLDEIVAELDDARSTETETIEIEKKIKAKNGELEKIKADYDKAKKGLSKIDEEIEKANKAYKELEENNKDWVEKQARLNTIYTAFNSKIGSPAMYGDDIVAADDSFYVMLNESGFTDLTTQVNSVSDIREWLELIQKTIEGLLDLYEKQLLVVQEMPSQIGGTK